MRRTILWSIAVWYLLLGEVLAASIVSTTDGLGLRFGAGSALEALVVDGQPLPAADLAGGFYVSEVSGEGAELIANGSLEEDRAGNGVPDGTTKDGVWQRDHTVARTGKWSMKAVVPGPDDGMSGSLGVIVPVEGGATYVASFWLKCEGRGGHSPASIGYLQQRNEKGVRTTEVVQRQMSGSVTGTRDWTPVRMMLTTEGDTRQLYFRTDIYHGTGTLWADDFSLKKISSIPVPLATGVVAADGGVRLAGSDAGTHLRIAATWKASGGMLRLDGQVVSTDERERCVRLSYRLPLAALGGTWGADIATAKPIAPGGIYSRTEAFGLFGPYSIYPFSAVVTKDKSAGVSLGVPMDPPRPFRLTYAANQGLAVEWDLALSALPTLFPRTADFHAVLYRHDPKWGFRSAAERYYRLFPDYFTVRVKHFGNWYYADLGKFTHPEDFGLAYNEMVTKDSVAADHTLGYLNFAYTEPWGWWGWALGLKLKEDEPSPATSRWRRF